METKKNNRIGWFFTQTELGQTIHDLLKRNNVEETNPQEATSFLEAFMVRNGALKYNDGVFQFSDFNNSSQEYSCTLQEAAASICRAQETIQQFNGLGKTFGEVYPQGPNWFIKKSLAHFCSEGKSKKGILNADLFSNSDMYLIQLTRFFLFLETTSNRTTVQSWVHMNKKGLIENIAHDEDDTIFLQKLVETYMQDHENKTHLLEGIQQSDEQKIMNALRQPTAFSFLPLQSQVYELMEKIKI